MTNWKTTVGVLAPAEVEESILLASSLLWVYIFLFLENLEQRPSLEGNHACHHHCRHDSSSENGNVNVNATASRDASSANANDIGTRPRTEIGCDVATKMHTSTTDRASNATPSGAVNGIENAIASGAAKANVIATSYRRDHGDASSSSAFSYFVCRRRHYRYHCRSNRSQAIASFCASSSSTLIFSSFYLSLISSCFSSIYFSSSSFASDARHYRRRYLCASAFVSLVGTASRRRRSSRGRHRLTTRCSSSWRCFRRRPTTPPTQTKNCGETTAHAQSRRFRESSATCVASVLAESDACREER